MDELDKISKGFTHNANDHASMQAPAEQGMDELDRIAKGFAHHANEIRGMEPSVVPAMGSSMHSSGQKADTNENPAHTLDMQAIMLKVLESVSKACTDSAKIRQALPGIPPSEIDAAFTQLKTLKQYAKQQISLGFAPAIVQAAMEKRGWDARIAQKIVALACSD